MSAKRAARDVDEAAGRRKRVDRIGVEHDELPRHVGLARRLGYRGADQRHVAMHVRVLHDAVALAHFSLTAAPICCSSASLIRSPEPAALA